ncbi:TPR-like protein [Magnetospirillum sp. UT-4]|nr:TPR-like protein [Magnetospirillum sp. UT-4]
MVAVVALAGCAAMMDPQGTGNTVGGVFNQQATDRAMSALTKGDYSGAEAHAMRALRYNSKDPVALLVAGLAYQGMGRYELARQYYEVIISNQYPGSIVTTGDTGVAQPRSLIDIARANMAVVDKLTGRNVPRSTAQSGVPPTQSMIGAPPLPVVDRAPPPLPGRPMVATGPLDPVGASVTPAPGRIGDAEANVAGRFRILKRLLDDGLITQDEFNKRRAANVGALLPMTQPVPAIGLERPIPPDEAVATRLRALGQTLEARGMTVAEHAAERSAILDGLLPDKPRKREVASLPPADLIEAGQAVGRVERMRVAGLVTADEARREKDALEKAFDSVQSSQRVAGTATGLRPAGSGSGGGGKPAAAATAAGKGWGVSLASAKSEEDARATWDRIKAKFPEELGKLDAIMRKSDKDGRWRVVAGPLAGKDAARKLCKTLKLHRQACDAVTM